MSEAGYIVSLDGERIGVTDPKGEATTLALADLNGVMIETNDSGPFGADVWWLLFGADDRMAVAFPQGADGEEEAINWLTGLPGFDHEAMIMAMGSTTNAVFPVWRARFLNRVSGYALQAAAESELVGRLRRPPGRARPPWPRRGAGRQGRRGRQDRRCRPSTVATPTLTEQGVDARAARRDHRLADAFAEQLAERMRKGAEHGEFLAADAETLSSVPTARGEQLGDHLQHLVALGMAEAVVDRLEVIGIDDQQCQRLAACAGSPRPLLAELVEAAAVEAGRSGCRGRRARPALRSARDR